MVTAMSSVNDYINNLPIDHQNVYDGQYLYHQTQHAKNGCKTIERINVTVANTLGITATMKLVKLKEDVSKDQLVELVKKECTIYQSENIPSSFYVPEEHLHK